MRFSLAEPASYFERQKARAKNVTAPWAATETVLGDRDFHEEKHPYRSEFERDRDRIVHSKAFRRLEYKTQVFVNHLGDNFRTRLTHSIEVSGIARSVGRALGLNEDLIESIALAHDLGHPPFGHAGEKALHESLRGKGSFDHNEQSLRVVTSLENRYPYFKGLNLTRATRLGLQKHNSLPQGMSHTLEAQIVDLCDEIAYSNHDVDDGIESGFLSLEEINEVQLWHRHWQKIQSEFQNTSRKVQVRYCIRNMINSMTFDLIQTTKSNLESAKISNLTQVLNYHNTAQNTHMLASFSVEMKENVVELKRFLFRKLYRHTEVQKMNQNAADVISFLFQYFEKSPQKLPENFQPRLNQMGLYMTLTDFIAGMTDRYALSLYHQLKA